MLSLYQTVSCNYTFQFQPSWSQQLYNSLSTICLAWERMCNPDYTRQRMASIWELNWVLEEFLLCSVQIPGEQVGQRWDFQDFQEENGIQLQRDFLLSSFYSLSCDSKGLPCVNKWQGVESVPVVKSQRVEKIPVIWLFKCEIDNRFPQISSASLLFGKGGLRLEVEKYI